MKPGTIDPELYTLALETLSPGQLDAWKLREAGLSYRRIATALNISRTQARDTTIRAYDKLDRARKEAA